MVACGFTDEEGRPCAAEDVQPFLVGAERKAEHEEASGYVGTLRVGFACKKHLPPSES